MANFNFFATLIESVAPTTSTKGTVGQLYLDTSTGTLYQCVAAVFSNTWNYTWKQIGGSGSKKYLHYINLFKSYDDPIRGYGVNFSLINDDPNPYTTVDEVKVAVANYCDYYNAVGIPVTGGSRPAFTEGNDVIIAYYIFGYYMEELEKYKMYVEGIRLGTVTETINVNNKEINVITWIEPKQHIAEDFDSNVTDHVVELI